MAINYIDVLSRCFPDSQAYVTGNNSPEVYDNLIWLTDPISQTALDTSPCTIELFDNTTGEELSTTYDVVNEGPILTFTFSKEATAKNTWLSHEGDNSLTSNKSPAVIPWDCKLVAMTFSNQKPNVDSDIEIYTAPNGSGSDDVLTYAWPLRNSRVGRKTDFSSEINFKAGDKVGLYLRDAGTDAKYVTVILFLQITSSDTEDFTETYTGDF